MKVSQPGVWAFLLWGSACLDPQTIPELREGPRVVEMKVLAQAPVDAHLPTDLLPTAGGIWVLDGAAGRLLRVRAPVAAAGAPETDVVVADVALLQGARRLAPARGVGEPGHGQEGGGETGPDGLRPDGEWPEGVWPEGFWPEGFWVVHPAGHLLRYSAEGNLIARRDVGRADCLPSAAAEWGEELLVACRGGEILALNHAGGARRFALIKGEQLEDGRTIVSPLLLDLVVVPEESSAPQPDRAASRAPQGDVVVVDAHLPGFHRLSPNGELRWSVGRHGLWVDAWSHPRSLTLGPAGSLLVADRELGVVQAVDLADGRPLGVLSMGGSPYRFGAPVAIRAGFEPGTFLVLQAAKMENRGESSAWDGKAKPETPRGAALYQLSLTPDAVGAARDTQSLRALRSFLAEPRPAGDPEGCAHCHDGVLTDGRSVFDPRLHFHPVNIPPEGETAAGLPLSDQGHIICTTCHSPHGAGGSSGFLREEDGPEALCVRCHGVDAHETALTRTEGLGQSHPSGLALESALDARGAAPGSGDCLDCHAVHGAVAAPLQRHGSDDSNCLGCHTDRAPGESASGHPMPDPRPMPEGGERPGGCRACHDLVGGQGDSLLRTAEGRPLCIECHDEVRSAGLASRVLAGPHGQLPAAQPGETAPCAACHSVHGGQRQAQGTLRNHLLRPGECADCHAGAQRPTGLADVGAFGVHHALSGPKPAPECGECHDPHTGAPDRRSCPECHEAPARAAANSPHGEVACAACHPVHSPGLADSPDATCAACHAQPQRSAVDAAVLTKAPLVARTAHPPLGDDAALPRWDALGELRLYGADGAARGAVEGGDLTCRSCHFTHGGPDGSLRRLGLAEGCAACHGDESLRLLQGFHDPNQGPARRTP